MQNPQHGGPHNNYLPLHPAVVTTNRVVYKDKVINQYTFGTKIGKGKNGTVYAAYLLSDDETTVETVAIKAIRRETNEGRSKRKYRGLRRNIPRQTNHTSVGDAIHSEEHRIRKEIAIMKKLHHPHVVQLREVLDDRLIQTIYLVMEYCDGGEVEWTDGHDNPISSLEQTRRIMRDAIQGLDYLHSQGIIHRDIKPANLLWTKDRAHVKIADFGTAHFSYAQRLSSLGNNTPTSEDPDDPFFLDDSGLAIKAGTPIFMAPEVVYDSIIRDDDDDPPPPQPITKAIDVWALGITFYCLLFGCLPYKLDHNLPSLSQEFAVYRSINKEEWSIKDTMGTDQISTQSVEEDSEAGIIIHLLYHFLTKNVTERITLAEVKSNPWFLNDLPNPVTWLQDLGVAQIIVSPQETSVAITSTEVKLGPWKRMARGISSVLGIGPILTRGRERQRDDQSSSSQGQQLGRHRTVTDMVRRPKEHLKGKGKEVERSLSRLRSSATLGRQLSVKSSRNDPATRSSNNSSMTWRFSKRSSQSSTPKPASPQEPNMSTFIPTRATSNSRLVGPRASAEVLGYPQSSNHGGGLTSDRRVSSFGDHPAELRNTVFEDNDDVVGDGHLQFGAPSSDSDENDAEGDSEEGTSQPRMVAHHLRQRLYDIPPSRHKSVEVIPYERERELDDSSSDDDDDGEGILIDFPRRR